jgi:hypothetical protein
MKTILYIKNEKYDNHTRYLKNPKAVLNFKGLGPRGYLL